MAVSLAKQKRKGRVVFLTSFAWLSFVIHIFGGVHVTFEFVFDFFFCATCVLLVIHMIYNKKKSV